MTERQLKKRIKDEHNIVWLKSQSTYENIDKIIDEALAEYPTLHSLYELNPKYWDALLPLDTELKSWLAQQELNRERDKWFKKWFGNKNE